MCHLDPITGSDSRILQKTDTHQTIEKKFIYHTRKLLKVFWQHCFTYKDDINTHNVW